MQNTTELIEQGLTFMRKNDINSALDAFDKAYSLDPANPESIRWHHAAREYLWVRSHLGPLDEVRTPQGLKIGLQVSSTLIQIFGNEVREEGNVSKNVRIERIVSKDGKNVTYDSILGYKCNMCGEVFYLEEEKGKITDALEGHSKETGHKKYREIGISVSKD